MCIWFPLDAEENRINRLYQIQITIGKFEQLDEETKKLLKNIQKT